MKKCVIIPDSFKGSLSSIEVCNIIKEKVEKFFPKCNAIMIPIADGGEGTVDTFIYSLKAEKVSLKVKNAFGEMTEVYYGRIKNKAIIEVAQVVGLTKAEGRENPSITSTYGVGEIINHAVENGCNEIFIGLGGSSTNDSGVGAAAALGTVFKDKNGKEFIPVGKNLNEVEYIDISKTLDKLNLDDVEIERPNVSVLRKDIQKKCEIKQEELYQNVKVMRDTAIEVPKIIE